MAIHFSVSGSSRPACGDQTAILLTDDRRAVTCDSCLDKVPSRLSKVAAVAYEQQQHRRSWVHSDRV